ncbi:MAG TPA: WS/DGAT domain-containing protein [Solirubrobacteraceae bacterium]|nr:WS/DGAT domain-containing protein [Solirubrobacteraceae bacterium]
MRAQKLLLDSATRALSPDPRRAAGDIWSDGAARRARQAAPVGADVTARHLGLGAEPPVRVRRGLARRPQARRQGRGRHGQRRVAGGGRRHAAPLPGARRPADRPAARRARARERPQERRGGRQRDLDGARGPARRRGRPARADRADPSVDDGDQESAAIRAGALLVGASGWAPPLVSSTLARATGGLRAFNVVVSNVPGPQQPFWLNGCRLLVVHPAVPLNPATQASPLASSATPGRSASACSPTAISTHRSRWRATGCGRRWRSSPRLDGQATAGIAA